jgi:hypothetical protein
MGVCGAPRDSAPRLPTLSLHGNGRECGVGLTVVMGGACRAGWTATASRTHRGQAGAGEQVVNENEVDKSKSEQNDVNATNRCMPCLAPVAVMGGRLPHWRERGGHPPVSHPRRARSRGQPGNRSVGTSLNGELPPPVTHALPVSTDECDGR